MFRRIMLALTFVSALGIVGVVMPEDAEARRGRRGYSGGVYYGGPGGFYGGYYPSRSYYRSYYYAPAPRYYTPRYYGYPDYYYYGRPRSGIYISF